MIQDVKEKNSNIYRHAILIEKQNEEALFNIYQTADKLLRK